VVWIFAPRKLNPVNPFIINKNILMDIIALFDEVPEEP
jgi:hypothetical protein